MNDIKQLELLFKQYQPGLFHFCMQYVRNAEDAHEIVNDAFMAVWEKRQDLSLTEQLKPYLYTIVRNKALNFLKRKRIPFTDLSEDFNVASNQADAADHIHARETETVIFALIERLPPKCKQIFLLSRREEMSYKEIAAILEVSEKTVENQIGLALKFIRNGLEKTRQNNPGFRVILWPWLAAWLSTMPFENISDF